MEKIKTHFDALSAPAQWEWIVGNRSLINEIIIDSDNTSIHLHGDEDASFEWVMAFKTIMENDL